MTPLKRDRPRLTTGAPLPAPVWQQVCEFANGSCPCARKGRKPCAAVEAAAARIADRAYHDVKAQYHLRRRAPSEGAPGFPRRKPNARGQQKREEGDSHAV